MVLDGEQRFEHVTKHTSWFEVARFEYVNAKFKFMCKDHRTSWENYRKIMGNKLGIIMVCFVIYGGIVFK